jgi:MFS superfamily sulfate permease-like transporter
VDPVPALAWLHTYRREWLRPDLIAAGTLWALVVPQSIAYSKIAGLPPEAGLFAALVAVAGANILNGMSEGSVTGGGAIQSAANRAGVERDKERGRSIAPASRATSWLLTA